MTETDLHFFIDSILNYFEEITNVPAAAGLPYLKDSQPLMLEYTGVIGISGQRRGCIYFTASQQMLTDLSERILGEKSFDPEVLKDLAGEIANTIAGNVRQAYGSSFMISVPVVVEGEQDEVRMPTQNPAFVIPVDWESQNSFLVISMQ